MSIPKFVIVENLKGEKIGYVEVSLRQWFGNQRDYCISEAMNFMFRNHADMFDPSYGSKFALGTVTKNKPKKLKQFEAASDLRPYNWHLNNTQCSEWFERDRALITLSDNRGNTIISLVDEQGSEFIEDGLKLIDNRGMRPCVNTLLKERLGHNMSKSEKLEKEVWQIFNEAA